MNIGWDQYRRVEVSFVEVVQPAAGVNTPGPDGSRGSDHRSASDGWPAGEEILSRAGFVPGGLPQPSD